MEQNRLLEPVFQIQLVKFLLAAMSAFPLVAVSETEKKLELLKQL